MEDESENRNPKRENRKMKHLKSGKTKIKRQKRKENPGLRFTISLSSSGS